MFDVGAGISFDKWLIQTSFGDELMIAQAGKDTFKDVSM